MKYSRFRQLQVVWEGISHQRVFVRIYSFAADKRSNECFIGKCLFSDNLQVFTLAWTQISNLAEGSLILRSNYFKFRYFKLLQIILSEGSDPINQKTASLSITHIFHFRQTSASCLGKVCKIRHCFEKSAAVLCSPLLCLCVFI